MFFLLFGLFIFASAQRPQRAADFSATSITGDRFDSVSLRGKVVLLTFWSTRCAICQNEIPHLNRLASEYNDRNVVFLAATTEGENLVTSYLRHQAFNFQILPDSFGLMLKFARPDAQGRVQIAYPDYYVIDRAGRLQYHDYGWDKTDSIGDAINRALSSR